VGTESRPAGSRRRGRLMWLKLRLSDEERRAIEELARGAEQTKSEYIRRLVAVQTGPRQRRPPRPRTLPPEAREAVRRLAKLGCSLVQLARWEVQRRSPAEAERVLLALREMADDLEPLRRALLKSGAGSEEG
jgi:hypothetical protein